MSQYLTAKDIETLKNLANVDTDLGDRIDNMKANLDTRLHRMEGQLRRNKRSINETKKNALDERMLARMPGWQEAAGVGNGVQHGGQPGRQVDMEEIWSNPGEWPEGMQPVSDDQGNFLLCDKFPCADDPQKRLIWA